PPSETPSQPVASHEKLRSLRDRAHAALAEQRQRMQSLEARLADQLEAVAAGLVEELADQAKLTTAAENHASELASAREAFDRDRADWEAEHAIAESQVHARWQELDARQAELDRRDEEAEAREQQH